MSADMQKVVRATLLASMLAACCAMAQTPAAPASDGKPGLDWKVADLAGYRGLNEVSADLWDSITASVPPEVFAKQSKLPESFGVSRLIRHPVMITRAASGFSREFAVGLGNGLVRNNSTQVFGESKSSITQVSVMGLFNVLSRTEATAPNRGLFASGERTVVIKYRLTRVKLPSTWATSLLPGAAWGFETAFERERTFSEKPGEVEKKTEERVTSCVNGERRSGATVHEGIKGNVIPVECASGDAFERVTTRYLLLEDYAFFILLDEKNADIERQARISDWS